MRVKMKKTTWALGPSLNDFHLVFQAEHPPSWFYPQSQTIFFLFFSPSRSAFSYSVAIFQIRLVHPIFFCRDFFVIFLSSWFLSRFFFLPQIRPCLQTLYVTYNRTFYASSTKLLPLFFFFYSLFLFLLIFLSL